MLKTDKFPRFIILVGAEGSGKKLVCNYIASTLGVSTYQCETGVDAVRRMITDANRVTMPMLYVVADADKMSSAAKNALLKITEEPPRNAYFIMTLTDINNTLSTLKSRACVLNMDNYSALEIQEYLNSKSPNNTMHKQIIDICSTPGEVDTLLSMNVPDFLDYVQLTIDNIATVSGSNAFKIANKIALKESDDKYDLKLFWKAFTVFCVDKMKESQPGSDDFWNAATGISITSKCLGDLRIMGINKSMLFDSWILEIRKEWSNG